MARKRLYQHSRFDGGMTHNNRDTSDLTKSSFIAHLDIYRENSRAFVMPGFVSDNAFGGSATGLKVYDVRNFGDIGTEQIYCLGTKLDGTGSKIFERDITGSEWRVPTNVTAFAGEGSANLISHPFFWYDGSADFYYPVTNVAAAAVAKHGGNAIANYEATWFASWLSSVPSGYTYNVRGFNNTEYLVKGGSRTGISSINSSTITVDAKTTALLPRTIASGDYTIGIFGVFNTPRESRGLIWDAASLLADQNIRVGADTVGVAGFPNNVFCTVSVPSFRTLETNGKSFMNVRMISGESAQLLYEITAPTITNQSIHDLNDYYGNSMLWYGRVPTNAGGTTFKEGIWAVGSGSAASQFGVSMLLDTTTLGLVERGKVFGSGMYFAHNADGSVSRLGNFETGTFDIPAYIETLFYGADTPFQKQLEGISVITENLPAGGTVEVQYRFDENSAFVSMGVSDTDDKQVHNFTKVAGVPIGKFKEIQFKIILVGKIALKSYLVSTTEEDDLSFNV